MFLYWNWSFLYVSWSSWFVWTPFTISCRLTRRPRSAPWWRVRVLGPRTQEASVEGVPVVPVSLCVSTVKSVCPLRHLTSRWYDSHTADRKRWCVVGFWYRRRFLCKLSDLFTDCFVHTRSVHTSLSRFSFFLIFSFWELNITKFHGFRSKMKLVHKVTF